MCQILDNNIFISSRYITSGSIENGFFTVNCTIPPGRMMLLAKFQTFLTYSNIVTSVNDSFLIGATTYNVTQGRYDLIDLMDFVQTSLDTEIGGTNSVSFNSITEKVIITTTIATTLSFAAVDSIWEDLGFDQEAIGSANSFTGDFIPKVSQANFIMVKLGCGSPNNCSNLRNAYTFIIYENVGKNAQINMNENDDNQFYVTRGEEHTLEIRFMDWRGRTLQNMSEWIITLKMFNK